MKKAVVIGTGAAGATAARELQGKYQVTMLEAGVSRKPFRMNLAALERLRHTRMFFSEKLIRVFIPSYRITKTRDRMALVHGIGVGGTTAFTCGNALRADTGLKALGIDLSEEFSELEREIPITADHRHLWRETTRSLFDICESKGLKPFAVPKAGHYERCRNCGRCTLGCPYGVKWDSSAFVAKAAANGASLVTGCKVQGIKTDKSRATGVLTSRGFFAADLVIVAAGGVNTPGILERSGIPVSRRFFVDPVLCVAAEYKNAFQNRELPMPFAVEGEGYIIAPYFDQLSFFFNKRWMLPAKNILSLMVKLADSETGSPGDKALTPGDTKAIEKAASACREIFQSFGIPEERTFFGTLNAGHPGGMLPLTRREARSMHAPQLPENVYVADATLFPASLGKPPMLTIMAMAKRISGIIRRKEW
jgi:choline dehydrogenase-like flavoprotein